VIRDSKEKSLQAYELVVGDLVQLRSGGRVPADLRVLYANGLKLETSSITGESEPSDYTSDAVDSNVSVFDSQNIAFNGSFVIEGEGIGVVIRTGSKTVCCSISSKSLL
jgi:sodium/potassium-transporting ATPase subunit alpha